MTPEQRDRVLALAGMRHLPGLHDQKSHGRRGPRLKTIVKAIVGAGDALQGKEALDSVPVKVTFESGAPTPTGMWATGFDGLAKPNKGAVAAVNKYLTDPGFTNQRLRSPTKFASRPDFATRLPTLEEFESGVGAPVSPAKVAKAEAQADRYVSALDRVMEHSQLPTSIVTYRGQDLPSLSLPADPVGYTWRDLGFVSTSTDEKVASYSFAGGGQALLRIVVPEGTSALQLGGLGESEVLLDRGLTFRIVADHGIEPNGARLLDVEIIPAA